MDNIFAPIVRTESSVVANLGTMSITELYSVTDFDFDSAVQRIRIRDNVSGGGNFFRGTESLAANQWHDFSTDQLGVLGYRGGPSVATETFSIQVYDGKFWSNQSSNIITSGKSKAVVTATPGRVSPNEKVRLDRFFDVTDSDGDPISRYMFVDRNANAGGGRLFVGTEQKAQARWFIVESGELSRVEYQGALQGREVENIGVMAWDGFSWSELVDFEMATTAAPIVVETAATVSVDQRKRATAFFNVTDADSDSIKTYVVADYRPNSDGGYWEYMGARMTSAKFFVVPANKISQLYYVGAANGPQSETVGLQVYDGFQFSKLKNFEIRTVVPPVIDGRDVAVKANHYLNFATGGVANSQGQMAPGTPILDFSDGDGDPITEFLFVDRRINSNGGHFVFKGNRVKSGEWFNVQAVELDQLEYRGGEFGPQDEYVSAMAFANGDWSPETTFRIDTLENKYDPELNLFNVQARPGVSIILSSMFTWSDMDLDAIKTFSLYDTGDELDSGFFTVSGVKQPPKSWITLTWDQLENVRYNMSSIANTEKIRMQISDGRRVSIVKTAELTSVDRPVIEATDNDISVDSIDRVLASSLITQLDSGPSFTQYQVYDENAFFRSGRLELDGVDMQQGVMHTLTADEFGRLVFKGAEVDFGRQLDPMLIRADNGITGWTEWERINVNTDVVGADALRSGRFWGEPGTDPGADPGTKTELTYMFIDGNGDHPAPGYYVCQPSPNPDDECNTAGEDKPLNQLQREAIREVFGYFSSIANLTFVEVAYSAFADDATIVIGSADLPAGVGAWAYFPSGTVASGNGSKPGDVWFDTDSFDPDNNFNVGLGSGFRSTAIHEFGHAIGLKHPFDSAPVLSIFNDYDYLTQMSYTHDDPVNNPFDPYADSPTTPMLYDLVEAQRLYGATTDHNPGDNHYGNNLAGSSPHFTSNTEQHQSLLWDSAGLDALNYTNHVVAETIDLREGAWSTINGVGQSIMIAYGTIIEHARGGSANDNIRGNETRNLLFGNDGDDTLRGGGDNDVNRGGRGSDTYVWSLGDGRDTVREESLGGIDSVEFYDPSGAIDFLEDDFVFRRMGNDLRIDLTLNRGEGQGTVSVINFADAASAVELMRIHDQLGNQIGNDIDLNSIFDTATSVAQHYRMTEVEGLNGGYIAMPVA